MQVGTPRLCPGCRSLDGVHDFGSTCTVEGGGAYDDGERITPETPGKVVWDRDPAASGPRSRAHLGKGWELIAYDDGRWEVRGPPIGHALAAGIAKSGAAARHACCVALKLCRS